MTIYLVRHAHAGKRSKWEGDDAERPLSSRGWTEAEIIRDVLGTFGVRRVIASPAVRCRQTVEPLASSVGGEVGQTADLAEGVDPTTVVALMERHGAANPVLCAHGDVIPEVIELLRRRGMKVSGATGNKKGAFWAIEWDGERFITASYHEPAIAHVA